MRLTGRAFPNWKLWFLGSLFFSHDTLFLYSHSRYAPYPHFPPEGDPLHKMLSSSNDPCYCSDAVHSVRYRTDFRFYSTMQSIHPSGHRCQNKLGMLSLLSRYENQEFPENQIYNLSHKPSKAPPESQRWSPSLSFFFHDNTQPSSHSSHCSANSCFTGYPDSTG